MKAVFKKDSKNGLIPCSEDAMKLWDKIPDDSYALVEYVRKRNYENHKRFMVLIDVTFEIQDSQENKEIWRQHIQMLAGHFETIIFEDVDGNITTQYWPKSIAYEKLDETEFQELFGRVIQAFLDRYGKGTTEQELLRVIDFG